VLWPFEKCLNGWKLKINYMEIRGKPKSKKNSKENSASEEESQPNLQEPVKISEINAPAWRNCQTHRTINVDVGNKSTWKITCTFQFLLQIKKYLSVSLWVDFSMTC